MKNISLIRQVQSNTNTKWNVKKNGGNGTIQGIPNTTTIKK